MSGVGSKRKKATEEEAPLPRAGSARKSRRGRGEDVICAQTVSPPAVPGSAAEVTTTASTITSVLESSNHHYAPPVLPPAPPALPSKQVVKKASAATNTQETEEEKTHLRVNVDELIGRRFQVIKCMGTGTFGKVYQCRDFKHNDIVALKCIRSVHKYIESAKVETKILNTIYKLQRDEIESGTLPREYCVKLYTRVYHGPHYCMAFEPLGPSLLDVLKSNDFRGLPMSFVHSIAKQLTEALVFMERIEVVHTDLKLENILFVQPTTLTHPMNGYGMEKQHFFGRGRRAYTDLTPTSYPSAVWGPYGWPYYNLPLDSSVKLIDFGGANMMPIGHEKTSIINTRQYRGPEVTLEIGWSFPSDMWSLGCVLAEIWTGGLLFATHENLEHLCLIEKFVGPYPDWMIRRSPVRRNFFRSDGTLRADTLDEKSALKVQSLTTLDASVYEDAEFVSLLRRMLEIDPHKRATPSTVGKERFFSKVYPLPFR